ncbi:glycosyltransferase family 4 protein [Flavobacterium enshiense]|uniref:glycosyltransferase family 4 protein n=1 Tax=Flavobacterium enshiense TaxID=1341165 RepID=UPI00345D98E6
MSRQFIAEGYTVVAVSEYKNTLVRMLDMLWAVLRYRNSDYVLIDTYSTSGFWYAFFVSQLCRFLHLSYIPILHGGNLPNRLEKNPKLCKMLFSNAYQNVAPSHYLMEAFTKAGFTNLTYIPNAIELANYPFKERKTIKPKLLWVRAFSYIYNPKMAVDVLNALQQHYPGATLCMIGPEQDGSMATTKKYAEEKEVTVHFTGRLPKPDWLALSSEYDIFINTTHFDNTPVSVMEAMALGLPVVTTNVGGIPYLLEQEKDGLLVADGEVTAMVAAIERLLEQPELALKLSQNARTKATSWDWGQVKLQWKKLLE